MRCHAIRIVRNGRRVGWMLHASTRLLPTRSLLPARSCLLPCTTGECHFLRD